MDLTPRTLDPVGTTSAIPGADATDPGMAPRRPASTARRLRTAALVVVVLGALGFVAFRGLGNATLFFYNVDEAVAKRAQLGDDRFRLQGSVADGELQRSGERATFTVVYADVTATVSHRGEIPKMFAPGIPVVLEGRWQDGVFASDRMLVKHSEVYVAENPDRVADYGETPAGGPAPSSTVAP